jgi:soluble lytic murein transglycosylase-like protein
MDASIQSAIVQMAQSLGVDPDLALAVAQQESGGNQSALSSAGAIGIFQLMPATAAALGVNPSDPMQNIQGGLTYLAQQLATFGDVSQALAAYNWGPANVKNAVAQYGSAWLSYAPAETQNYVSSILASLGITGMAVASGAAASIPVSVTTSQPFPWGYAALAGAGVLVLLL